MKQNDKDMKIQKGIKTHKGKQKSLHMSKLSLIWDNKKNGGVVRQIILEHISKFMNEQFAIR